MYYAYSHNRSGRCVSRIASAWDVVRGIGRGRLRTEFDDGAEVCRGVDSTAGFGEDVEILAMRRLGIVEIGPDASFSIGPAHSSYINSTYST